MRLSHRALPRTTAILASATAILAVKVEAVQGKQDPLEWTETSGGSWNGGTTHEFLSPFLCSAPPLEMRRKRREFFPEQAGKVSLL